MHAHREPRGQPRREEMAPVALVSESRDTSGLLPVSIVIATRCIHGSSCTSVLSNPMGTVEHGRTREIADTLKSLDTRRVIRESSGMRRDRRFPSRVVLLALCALTIPDRVLAQNPNARPPRNPANPAKGTAGRSQLPRGAGSLALPAWLDDAETLDPGGATIELSVGRWTSVDGGETDGPILAVAVGLTDRFQLNATIPYYSASYNDGYKANGLGDTYLSLKAQLLDPREHTIGVSVQPVLEILSESSVSDATLGLSRVNFGFPLTIQVGNDETRSRAYASAGYFTRNALFVGGAVERDVSSAVTLVAMLTHSYATRIAASSDLAGLSRSRTDASGMIYVSVAPTVTVFGGLGRTVSQLDQNGASLIASVGVRFETKARRTKP